MKAVAAFARNKSMCVRLLVQFESPVSWSRSVQ